jgi:hypothetical protein
MLYFSKKRGSKFFEKSLGATEFYILYLYYIFRNKSDLDHQRGDRILVPKKKEFFTKLKTSHEQEYSASCKSPETFQFVIWLRVQNAAQKIRQNTSILNRVSWTRRDGACIANDGKHSSNFFDVSFYSFTHNFSIFTLLFKPLLFSE